MLTVTKGEELKPVDNILMAPFVYRKQQYTTTKIRLTHWHHSPGKMALRGIAGLRLE